MRFTMHTIKTMGVAWILVLFLPYLCTSTPVSEFSTSIKGIVNRQARYVEFTGQNLEDGKFGASIALSPLFSVSTEEVKPYFKKTLDRMESRFSNIKSVMGRVLNELREPRTDRSRPPTEEQLIPCSLDVHGLKYDADMKTHVARNTSCIIYDSPGGPGTPGDKALLVHVASVLREEENNANWRKRMMLAFTTLGGDTVLYPALQISPSDMAIPRRQWLSGTLHPRPKDIVIIYDASHRMSDNVEGTNVIATRVLKDTFKKLLDTLSTRDRIALVAASPGQQVPPGDSSGRPGSCVRSNMAFVTKDLRNYLQHHFIDTIELGTPNLSQVFQRAFGYFKNHLNEPLSNLGRERILLTFMASRNLQASEYSDALKILKENYELLNGSIEIVGVTIKVKPAFPEPVANHTTDRLLYAMTHADYIRTTQVGGYTTDVQGAVMWFHKMFYSPGEHITIASQFPKLGPTVHSCSHLKLQEEFVGLLCAIVPTVDVEADFDIPDYMTSYGFMLDSTGSLLLYPSLRPAQNPDRPIRIESLERFPEFSELLPKIIRGESVDVQVQRNFTKRHGKNPAGGGISFTVMTDFKCDQIRGTDLSICLVSIHGDDRVAVRQTTIPEKFLYHRLDLMDKPFQDTCRYYCYEIYPDFSTYMLTEKAFEPGAYPGRHQTKEFVEQLTRYMENGKVRVNLPIKDGVRQMYTVVAELVTQWDYHYQQHNIRFNAKWLYAGFIYGVFVVYPGTQSDDSYDHTTRPWYILAMSNPRKIMLTRPYIDFASDPEKKEYVISICKAVTVGTSNNDDFPIGVICVDYTMTHFQNLVADTLSKPGSALCPKDSEVICFLVDESGYVVSHDNFTDYHKDVLDTHLLNKEPLIAKLLMDENVLRKKYCIDISAREEQPIWEIHLNGKSQHTFGENKDISVTEINGTNIFLVVIKGGYYRGKPLDGYCQRRGCQPEYSYNCSCPAPIDGCDFIYHETSESSVLPFCPTPIYGRDQDLDGVCSVKLKNTAACYDNTGCERLTGQAYTRSCADADCTLCVWRPGNNQVVITCQRNSICNNVTTTTPVVTVTTTTATTERSPGGLPQDTMSVLTITLSIVISLLFIIVLIAVCSRWPRRNLPPASPYGSGGSGSTPPGMDRIRQWAESTTTSAPTEDIYAIGEDGIVTQVPPPPQPLIRPPPHALILPPQQATMQPPPQATMVSPPHSPIGSPPHSPIGPPPNTDSTNLISSL